MSVKMDQQTSASGTNEGSMPAPSTVGTSHDRGTSLVSAKHDDLQTISVAALDEDSEQPMSQESATDTEETDYGSGNDAAGGQGEKAGKEKKKRAGYAKKGDIPTFIAKGKNRTTRAKNRASTMLKGAEALEKLTHGRVFLKIKYKTPRNEVLYKTYGVDDFSATEDDILPQPPVEQGPQDIKVLDPDNLKQIVAEGVMEGVKEGVAAGLASLPQQATPSSPPPAASSQDDLFSSPSVATRTPMVIKRKVASALECQKCCSDDEWANLPNLGRVKSGWFECVFEECGRKCHSFCVGMPEVDYSKIRDVAPWWCLLHVRNGKPAVSVEQCSVSARTRSSGSGRASKGTLDSGDATRGRGRGGRRGRGKQSE